jgi:PilZ domain
MRIHYLVFNNANEFFDYFKTDRFLFEFNTKAEFKKGEVIILEIFFKDFANREHFRVEILRTQPSKTNENKIWVKILPYQGQKVDFISYLSANNEKWISKREFRRHAVSIKGAWSYKSPDLWHPCEINDLGIGGSLFFTSSCPTIGSRIYLRFTIPNTDTAIKLSADVVWIKRLGTNSIKIGIKFLPISEKSKSKKAYKKLRLFFRQCEIHGNIAGSPNEDIDSGK